MKRPVLAAVLAATAVLAGCGTGAQPASAPAPATSAAPVAASIAPPVIAPVGSPAPGIPALSGDPTDLKSAVQATAGTADPPAGLLAQDLVVGTGAVATAANTVDVRYTGTLYSDGSAFDSSWSGGDATVQFPLDGVVPGFAQGIEGMKAGGRRVIVIPPALGYGSRATGPIPGNSTLVFVVDLVSIA